MAKVKTRACSTDGCAGDVEQRLSRSGHQYKYCATCWRRPEVRSEFNRGQYEDKKWDNICVSCGADTDGASVRCPRCKTYQQRLRAIRVAAGACVRCLNPKRELAQSSTGRTLKVCTRCLNKARAYKQQWLAKQAVPTD